MFGTILKATNSSFQKGMTFCRSIYGKTVMRLLSFIFEQPSYIEHCFTVDFGQNTINTPTALRVYNKTYYIIDSFGI